MDVAGSRVTIVGMARSGLAAAKFLAERGATVLVSDSKPAASLAAELETLKRMGVGFETGRNSDEALLAADLVVVSPGVPLELPPIARAISSGVEVIGEVELACRFMRGSMIGITGSNGKTTTTSLTGLLMREAGFHTLVGGNIGTPLISLVAESRPESVVVAELSSFQLEATSKLHLHVASVLNITPNHLDRYARFEDYVEAKRRIFLNQTEDDWAVLNADNAPSAGMAASTPARKLFFSATKELEEGVFLRGEEVVCRCGGEERVLVTRPEIQLQGLHNVENVMAAMAVGVAAGADPHRTRTAVRRFEPVEHRLEPVAEVKGVRFINDSKATSVDAAVKALQVFTRDLVLILGGKDKGSDYTLLRPLMAGRVKAVVLIGAASDKIASALEGYVPLVRSSTMRDAVEKAFERAQPEGTVLLAPACSSFDMFESFEQRGTVYKEEVRRLKARVE